VIILKVEQAENNLLVKYCITSPN